MSRSPSKSTCCCFPPLPDEKKTAKRKRMINGQFWMARTPKNYTHETDPSCCCCTAESLAARGIHHYTAHFFSFSLSLFRLIYFTACFACYTINILRAHAHTEWERKTRWIMPRLMTSAEANKICYGCYLFRKWRNTRAHTFGTRLQPQAPPVATGSENDMRFTSDAIVGLTPVVLDFDER